MPRHGKLSSVLIALMVLPLLTPNIVVGYLFNALSLPRFGPLAWAASHFGLDLVPDTTISAWALLLLMDVWHWASLVVLFAYAGLKAIPEEYSCCCLSIGWPRLPSRQTRKSCTA